MSSTVYTKMKALMKRLNSLLAKVLITPELYGESIDVIELSMT